MDDADAFGGTAGQVIRGFVRPGTLLTTVPVIVVTLILGLVSAAVVDMLGVPAPIALVVMLVASSPVVGRFALPARDGELEAGFVEARFDGPELGSFVLRYAALTCAWALPCAVFFLWVAPSSPASAADGGWGALLIGPTALVAVCAVVIALLAPTLSLLIATRTDTVADALSGDAWRWLAVARRRDLVVFYAALVGGMVLFVVLAAIVLLVVAALAFFVSPGLAASVALFAWIAPGAASPVLLGRLAGAFVLAEVASPGPQPVPGALLGGGDVPAATLSALARARSTPASDTKTGRSAGGVLDLTRRPGGASS